MQGEGIGRLLFVVLNECVPDSCVVVVVVVVVVVSSLLSLPPCIPQMVDQADYQAFAAQQQRIMDMQSQAAAEARAEAERAERQSTKKKKAKARAKREISPKHKSISP